MVGHTIIMFLLFYVSAQTEPSLLPYVNIPGAVHDSQISDYGDIYDKLETVYQRDGGQCTVDSAFGNVNQ